MTDTEQQIAIATECGWRDIGMHPHPLNEMDTCLAGRFGLKEYLHTIPDYLNDLNASHEMEEHVYPLEIDDYANALQGIVGKYWFKQGKAVIHFTQAAWLFATAHATACQRAEAFLRMKGKWKE